MTRERPAGTGAKARSAAASRNFAGPAAPAQRGSAPAPSNDEKLRQEIERTREELGETVEALVAKTDVKGRAKDRAAQLSVRMREKTMQAKAEATARAGQVRSQLTGKAADARHAAAAAGGPARNQFQVGAAVAGGAVRDTPAALQRAAWRAAVTVSQRRVLAAAAGASAMVAGYLALRRWTRR
jgi:Protein of unknown function (DUF3618)